ncbi:cobalamin biosynthesis protein [Burkholderia perseverans]|uniref:cobalamin biosynthesis protein n=1 Tax=Burkholderia perseverans TaxID=2615214 RepID=UPI001FEFACEF|nr:cobalamin biosynthesis protein [Burkholderia perseverans]
MSSLAMPACAPATGAPDAADAADALAPSAAPWRVAIGVGCRAGRPAEAIDAAIDAALARHPGLSREAIALVATLDAKAAEPGLVACCARHGWPLVAITREAIAALTSGPDASSDAVPTSAVQARFGVAGVCEPCARAAVPNGTLLVPKTILDGVTVAIAGPL